MRNILLACFFCLMMFVVSCSKYDYNNINVNYDGEWAVPVISSRMDFTHLVSTDKGNVQYDEDGLIKLVYAGSNIGSVYLADLIKLPYQQFATDLMFTVPPIPFQVDILELPEVKVSIGVPLNMNDTSIDQKLDKVIFKGGTLYINEYFNYTPTIPIRGINVKINNLYYPNGQSVNLEFAADSYNEINLDGMMLDLNTDELKIDISIAIDKPLSYPYPGEELGLNLNLSMDNMTYKELRGYMGNVKVDYNDTIHIQMFDRISGGSIGISNFKADFVLSSSVGAPIHIRENYFKALECGGKPTVMINDLVKDIYLPMPSAVHAFSRTDVNLTSPTLSNAISSMYRMFAFQYNIELNPVGSQSNYIFDDSRLDIEMDFEIPLEGSLNEVVFIDTIAVNIPNIDMLKKLVVNANMTNNFPIAVSFQMIFLDENYNRIRYENGEVATLFPIDEPLVEAAKVGSDGKVVSATSKNTIVEIEYKSVEALSNAKYACLIATVNSKGYNGSKQVKLYNTGYFDVKIGMRVKTDINI